MKRTKSNRPPVKQPTPSDLIIHLEAFIRTKWYPGDNVGFSKDRPLLHRVVILKLATYLQAKGVTIPAARYREIMDAILMDALLHGEQPRYVPAWLGKVMQTHLAIHGEDYYEEGKALRNRFDSVLSTLAGQPRRERDPVRELADAARLVKARKRVKNAPVKAQLTLL